MLGTHNLPIFIASGILLNLTPGQDTFYIVGRSIAQGRRAGVLSALGITTGSAVHTCAAAFGLSAILATSARAFLIVKLAGAAYLAYLGIKLMLQRPGAMTGPSTFERESGWTVFRAGMLTNVLNPKVALFFMAFLPQFVSPEAESKIAAFLFLGALFMFTGTLWSLVLAWSASAISGSLGNSRDVGSWMRRAAGAVFVGLGVKLAISR